MNPENTNVSSSGGPNKLMGVLAYLGILIIIPFLVARKDSFVKFHIQQGLVLFIIEAIIWFLGMFMGPLWILLNLVNLAVLVFAIIGIINVVQGNQKELPLVGQFAHHLNF